MYVCTYVRMYVYVYVCICIYMYMYMYICIHMCILGHCMRARLAHSMELTIASRSPSHSKWVTQMLLGDRMKALHQEPELPGCRRGPTAPRALGS